MKSYPSISTSYAAETTYFVFDKIDGSNIRADWTIKRGFTRFGSRRRLLHDGDALWHATEVIRQNFEHELGVQLRNFGAKEATCFFEYAGPNSFAGEHPDPESVRTASVIDVHVSRKGLLHPREFLQVCDQLKMPKFFGEIELDETLLDAVRHQKLKGMTFEGIVCKQVRGRKIHMSKVKSLAWLERLRSECKTNEEFELRK